MEKKVVIGNSESIKSDRYERLMSLSGYLMLMFGATLLCIQSFYTIHQRKEKVNIPNEFNVNILLNLYGYEIIGFLGAIILIFVGLRLLGAAGKTNTSVIPEQDRNLLEPLVRDANKEAINQYVVLSSLSGFTGTFQKIGFSGLPLATVVLTIFFCFLSLIGPEGNTFIDFAKLTLGAFIGSFVQRTQDASKIVLNNQEKS